MILTKIKYYGVSGVELRLLSNYLSDRVQYVEYLGEQFFLKINWNGRAPGIYPSTPSFSYLH